MPILRHPSSSTTDYVLVGCRACGEIFRALKEEPKHCYNPICNSRYVTVLKTKDLATLELDILAIQNNVILNELDLDIDPLRILDCYHYAPMITITGGAEINKYLGECCLPIPKEFPLISITREKQNNKIKIVLEANQFMNTLSNVLDIIDVASTIRTQLVKAAKRIIKEAVGLKEFHKGENNNDNSI